MGTKIKKGNIELYTFGSIDGRGHYHKVILDAIEQMLKSAFKAKLDISFENNFDRYDVNPYKQLAEGNPK